MKRILLGLTFAAIVAGCNNNAKEVASANAVRDSIRIAHEKARLDSFERAEEAEKAAVVAAAAVAKERASTRTSRTRSYSGSSNRASYISSNPDVVYTTPQPAQKKGWSSAAKGAVIGGVAGAATGILVDKKDGRGAAIGGVVGAGTGYVIGRSKDRRTGRVQ
ncbi:YMGG-like glycine zipper-containing protein [Daejeonella lutea]|uniref:Type IV secretion system putative lipoprotein virB7 n=1 Tax=Daejeonella lutea TaxID=572036 RepID=A0A1T5AQ98_9SPHI|nr:YMGG-like glycine zipper-containing protein [Daejeonella lutea]SKB37096.1 Glycine zipper [Daejeonella lutea]